MKKYLSLFVVGVLFGVISCKTNCPEFDKKILSWIPYQENDMIELYSLSKDSTILFSIESIEVTHTTSYAFGTDCGGCSDDIRINDYNSDFQLKIYLNENKVRSQNYKIFDTYFTTYSEFTNYLFEDKEYDVVRIFDNNDSKVSFKKLIIAKEIGIIGLIDTEGNTWALKTNAKIRRLNDNEQRKGIVINNVSC